MEKGKGKGKGKGRWSDMCIAGRRFMGKRSGKIVVDQEDRSMLYYGEHTGFF
jgi:hypothetical protein